MDGSVGFVRIGNAETHLGLQMWDTGPVILVARLRPGEDAAAKKTQLEPIAPVEITSKPGESPQLEQDDEERSRHSIWLFPEGSGHGFFVVLEYDKGDQRAADYGTVARSIAASVTNDADWPQAERAERHRAAGERNATLARSLWNISRSGSTPFALVNAFGIALMDVHALDRDAMSRCDAQRALQEGLQAVGEKASQILKSEGAIRLSSDRYVFIDVDQRDAMRRAATAALQLASAASQITSGYCPPDTHFLTIAIHRVAGFGADPELPPTIEGDPVGELRDLLRLQTETPVVISQRVAAELGEGFRFGRRFGGAGASGGEESVAWIEVLVDIDQPTHSPRP